MAEPRVRIGIEAYKDTTSINKAIRETNAMLKKGLNTKISGANTGGIAGAAASTAIRKTFGQSIKEITRGLDTMSSKFFSTSASLRNMAAIAAAGVAGITYTLKKTFVDTAMNAIEIENLFAVTFKDSLDSANAFAINMSSKWGLNIYDLKNQFATLVSLMKGVEFPTKEITNESQSLTKAIYDLASLKNLSFEESFQAVKSGLTGETEPLKHRGINVTQEAVLRWAKVHKLTKGIERNLTQGEKAFVRGKLITEALDRMGATGDMLRTINQPANQVRVTIGKLQKMFANIGIVLLPVFMDLLKTLQDNIPLIQELAISFGRDLVPVLREVLPELMKGFITFLKELNTTWKSMDKQQQEQFIKGLVNLAIYGPMILAGLSAISFGLGTVTKTGSLLLGVLPFLGKAFLGLFELLKAITPNIFSTFIKNFVFSIRMHIALLQRWVIASLGTIGTTITTWLEGLGIAIGGSFATVLTLAFANLIVWVNNIIALFNEDYRNAQSKWLSQFKWFRDITDWIGEMIYDIGLVTDAFATFFTEGKNGFKGMSNQIEEVKKGLAGLAGGAAGMFAGAALGLPGMIAGGMYGSKVAKNWGGWHDNGGVFNQPTMIGVGEKRPEIVAAVPDVQNIISNAVQSAMLAGAGQGVQVTVKYVGGAEKAVKAVISSERQTRTNG